MSVDLCCPNCSCFIHTVHSENNYKEPTNVKSCPTCGDGKFPWGSILLIFVMIIVTFTIGVFIGI